MGIPFVDYVVPDYTGLSSPFAKGDRNPPRPDEIRKSGAAPGQRMQFFVEVLGELAPYFDAGLVPYKFRTPTGLRRLDHGALKHAQVAGSIAFELSPDGRIAAVRLTRRHANSATGPLAAANRQPMGQTLPKAMPTDEPGPTPTPDPMDPFVSGDLLADDRHRVLSEQVIREGQGSFRTTVLALWKGRCALTKSRVEAVLDAAHICPYLGSHSNDMRNGIALRADIHRLFDRGMITFRYDGDEIVTSLDSTLSESGYRKLDGQRITLPMDRNLRPSAKCLEWHRTSRRDAVRGGETV